MDILNVFHFLYFLGIPADFLKPSLTDTDESCVIIILFKSWKKEYVQKIRVYAISGIVFPFAAALAQREGYQRYAFVVTFIRLLFNSIIENMAGRVYEQLEYVIVNCWNTRRLFHSIVSQRLMTIFFKVN